MPLSLERRGRTGPPSPAAPSAGVRLRPPASGGRRPPRRPRPPRARRPPAPARGAGRKRGCPERSARTPPGRGTALGQARGRDPAQPARELRGEWRGVGHPAGPQRSRRAAPPRYRASRTPRTSLGVTRTTRAPRGLDTFSGPMLATNRPSVTFLRLTSARKSSSWRRRRKLSRPSTRTTTVRRRSEVTCTPGAESRGRAAGGRPPPSASVATNIQRPIAKTSDASLRGPVLGEEGPGFHHASAWAVKRRTPASRDRRRPREALLAPSSAASRSPSCSGRARADHAVDRERDHARLLGDHDDHRIRLLGQTNRRAMTCAQRAGEAEVARGGNGRPR